MRKHSPTPEEGSPIERASASPKRSKLAERDGSYNSQSPGSRSPERDSPVAARYESPIEANGRANGGSRSLSPRDGGSPIEEDDDDNNHSPRGSESP